MTPIRAIPPHEHDRPWPHCNGVDCQWGIDCDCECLACLRARTTPKRKDS